MARFKVLPDRIEMRPMGDDLLALSLMQELLASVGEEPDDPAAGRLSVAAYPQDGDAQSEYERLMNPELDRQRRMDRDAVASVLKAAESGTVDLTAPEAEALLMVLNEARLALGARLGIVEDGWDSGDRRASDPVALLLRYLTGYQDDLVRALAKRFET
ncbi:MAG: DUF2017 family protein [bacterium]|nr:DUF2017 family protein [bacterium]